MPSHLYETDPPSPFVLKVEWNPPEETTTTTLLYNGSPVLEKTDTGGKEPDPEEVELEFFAALLRVSWDLQKAGMTLAAQAKYPPEAADDPD